MKEFKIKRLVLPVEPDSYIGKFQPKESIHDKIIKGMNERIVSKKMEYYQSIIDQYKGTELEGQIRIFKHCDEFNSEFLGIYHKPTDEQKAFAEVSDSIVKLSQVERISEIVKTEVWTEGNQILFKLYSEA